jgi:hypothetical protein
VFQRAQVEALWEGLRLRVLFPSLNLVLGRALDCYEHSRGISMGGLSVARLVGGIHRGDETAMNDRGVAYLPYRHMLLVRERTGNELLKCRVSDRLWVKVEAQALPAQHPPNGAKRTVITTNNTSEPFLKIFTWIMFLVLTAKPIGPLVLGP